MPTDQTKPAPSTIEPGQTQGPAPRKLTPAAARALAEAAARRTQQERAATEAPKEINGRDGPEPTRYGDWEIKGLTSDF